MYFRASEGVAEHSFHPVRLLPYQRSMDGIDLASLLEARVREIANEVVGASQPVCRFVSKSKLAEVLGVSERRVKTLREHGLPGRKVGRDLYFDLIEVERFIDREGH